MGTEEREDEDERGSRRGVGNIPYARRRWWRITASVLLLSPAVLVIASFFVPWSTSLDVIDIAGLRQVSRMMELGDQFGDVERRVLRQISGVGVQDLANDVDVWGRPLVVIETKAEVAIVSRGPDGLLGTNDDWRLRQPRRHRAGVSARSRSR